MRVRFQFTHPGRGATVCWLVVIAYDNVSIHAPREGCDPCWQTSLERRSRFQFTHPGRGATTERLITRHKALSFNSRTPGGVRLNSGDLVALRPIVSIHAPREGCDRGNPGGKLLTIAFQFTHPGRGATTLNDRQLSYVAFQFTHPGRGATRWAWRRLHPWRRFNSRTPGGVRLNSRDAHAVERTFQFTHPGRGATKDCRHSEHR